MKRVGFEPTKINKLLIDLQSIALNHSAISSLNLYYYILYIIIYYIILYYYILLYIIYYYILYYYIILLYIIYYYILYYYILYYYILYYIIILWYISPSPFICVFLLGCLFNSKRGYSFNWKNICFAYIRLSVRIWLFP